MCVDINDIALDCDRALEHRDISEIGKLVQYLKSILSNVDLSDLELSHINYFLGNLYASIAKISGEDPSGWRTNEFPLNRAEAINYYRLALEFAEKSGSYAIQEIRANLANEIAHHRRNIECLN